MRTKHPKEQDEKVRKNKEEAKTRKELSKETELLQDVIEMEEEKELVSAADAALKRAEKINELKGFSKSFEKRKTKVIQPRGKWMRKTVETGLGELLGNLALPESLSCRECDLRDLEIKEHDKIIQSKNEELYEKDMIIKEMGGMLEVMAGCTPGSLLEVKELKEEISKMKEVEKDGRRWLELYDKEREDRKKEVEVKKETIKKMKIDEIKLKDAVKSLKKDLDAKVVVQGTNPEQKKKEVTRKETKGKESKQKEEVFKCTKCDKQESTKSNLMIHLDLVHSEHVVKSADNKEVCRNGDNCSWKRNNRCSFVHKSSSDLSSHSRNNHSGQKREEEPCRNGPSCGFRKNNACRFSHQQGEGHGRWEQQSRPNGFRRHLNSEHREGEPKPVRKGNVRNPGVPVEWCSEDRNCKRKRYCMFKHKSFHTRANQPRN